MIVRDPLFIYTTIKYLVEYNMKANSLLGKTDGKP